MTPAERVLNICNEKGIKISKLEKDCGFANAYIKGLRSGKIPAERVRIIADYLDVPYYKIDPDTYPKGSPNNRYYISAETLKIAQQVYDDPDLRLLFDAAQNVKSEDIRFAAELLKRFKETNPDG